MLLQLPLNLVDCGPVRVVYDPAHRDDEGKKHANLFSWLSSAVSMVESWGNNPRLPFPLLAIISQSQPCPLEDSRTFTEVSPTMQNSCIKRLKLFSSMLLKRLAPFSTSFLRYIFQILFNHKKGSRFYQMVNYKITNLSLSGQVRNGPSHTFLIDTHVNLIRLVWITYLTLGQYGFDLHRFT